MCLGYVSLCMKYILLTLSINIDIWLSWYVPSGYVLYRGDAGIEGVQLRWCQCTYMWRTSVLLVSYNTCLIVYSFTLYIVFTMTLYESVCVLPSTFINYNVIHELLWNHRYTLYPYWIIYLFDSLFKQYYAITSLLWKLLSSNNDHENHYDCTATRVLHTDVI